MASSPTIRIDQVSDPLAVTPQSRTVSAGTGLSGGGDLSADRTFALSAGTQASLAKADTAAQPGDLATVATTGAYSDLSGKPTLGSAAAASTSDFATAAQGALADSATQPGDLAAVATTGAYGDLAGAPTLGDLAAKDLVDVADIDATGTPDGTTYLRGDGSWSTPAGGGGSSDGTAGHVQFSGGSGAFASDNGQFFWDSTNNRLGIGTTSPGSAIEAVGALTLSGTTTVNYTTPVLSSVGTKINVPLFDPGAYGQIMAMGLDSGAAPTARVISLFDARSSAHQPTIGVFDPTENDLFGLSWDGSSSTAYLKTLASNIGIRVNTTDIITFSTTGAIAVAGSTFTLGGSQVLSAANLGAQIAAATGKTTPVDGDTLALSDSAASDATKKLTWANVKATLWTSFGALIAGGTGKTTPVDADTLALSDSAASDATKKLTWANLKATLKTYFDTLYALATHSHAWSDITSGKPTTLSGYGITDAIANSLLTTRGDIITRGASAPQRLALGTSGYYLKSDGTDAVWAAVSSPGWTVLSGPTSLSGSSTGFTSISSSYADLMIVCSGLSGTNTADLRIEISVDNGSNYSTARAIASALANGGTYTAAILISGYLKDIGSVIGSVTSSAASSPHVSGTSGTLTATFLGTGGINAARVSLSAGTFDAGTITLLAR